MVWARGVRLGRSGQGEGDEGVAGGGAEAAVASGGDNYVLLAVENVGYGGGLGRDGEFALPEFGARTKIMPLLARSRASRVPKRCVKAGRGGVGGVGPEGYAARGVDGGIEALCELRVVLPAGFAGGGVEGDDLVKGREVECVPGEDGEGFERGHFAAEAG